MEEYIDLYNFIHRHVYIKDNIDVLVITAVREILLNFDITKLQKKLEYYKIKHGYKTHLLILNSWFKRYDNEFKKFKINVVYIDLWLKYTYEKLFLEKLSPVKTEFSYNKKNSFLFLMGKSYRANRIRLFYMLLKNHCIKRNTLYTLRHNAHEKTFDEALNVMQDVIKTRKDLKIFFKKYKKEIDVTYDTTVVNKELHYMGIPYNVDMFLNSNFQIIPETEISTTWITEKTWISIANKMPFMIVSAKNTCAYLESLGFRTFREYMKYPNYDENYADDNYDSILEPVVENVCHWEKNLHKFQDSLEKDVEHNFKIFQDRYLDYLKTEDYICKNYGIDKQFLNNNILGGYPNHYPVKKIA
jgi:hypothetical protein